MREPGSHVVPFIGALLLLVSLSNSAPARTVGFQSAVSYPAGPAAGAVVIRDFNGDGIQDLGVANNGDPGAGDDGDVSILIGNGDGTFQAASSILVGKNPQSLVAGDFNGDGKFDLAVLNSDDTLSVSLGNDDGTFQTRVDYTTSTGSSALSLADVNGDHRPDLIVPQAGSGLGNSGSVALEIRNTTNAQATQIFRVHLRSRVRRHKRILVSRGTQIEPGRIAASENENNCAVTEAHPRVDIICGEDSAACTFARFRGSETAIGNDGRSSSQGRCRSEACRREIDSARAGARTTSVHSADHNDASEKQKRSPPKPLGMQMKQLLTALKSLKQENF